MIVDLVFISFKVAFKQVFLTSAGNMVTSEKVLGTVMKCDTSDPDYPKVGNVLIYSSTTALMTLCKTLTRIFAKIYAPLHLFCICLIR